MSMPSGSVPGDDEQDLLETRSDLLDNVEAESATDGADEMGRYF